MEYSPGRQKPNVASSTGKMAALKVFFPVLKLQMVGLGEQNSERGGGGGGGERRKGVERDESGGGGGGGDKRLEAGRLFGTFQVAGKMPPQPHPATVHSSCSVPLFLSQVKTWPP